jgi:hypothetical protein
MLYRKVITQTVRYLSSGTECGAHAAALDLGQSLGTQ